jgi:hypothetical protein
MTSRIKALEKELEQLKQVRELCGQRWQRSWTVEGLIKTITTNTTTASWQNRKRNRRGHQ